MTTMKTRTALGLLLAFALLAPWLATGKKPGGGGRPPDPPIPVKIMKASYDSATQKLLVYGGCLPSAVDACADYMAANGVPLVTITIEGFVTDAPAEFHPYQQRYRYEAETPDDLDGRLVTANVPELGLTLTAQIH